MNLQRTNSNKEDFKRLSAQLDAHYWKHYGDIQARFDAYHAEVLQAVDTAIVVYKEDKPIGCGCFLDLGEGVAEIKRVFVLPEYRGQGVATKLVKALEGWAADEGYTSLVLETGIKEEAAMRLYQKLGYHEIPNYGFYREVPVSICYGKEFPE